MATRPVEAKVAILEAAVSRARALAPGVAGDVGRFVRTYYAHVAPEDLIDRNDFDLCGAALAPRKVARIRQPGNIKVHVYNPNVEEHGWESPHTLVECVNDDMPFLVDSISMEVTRHRRASTCSCARSSTCAETTAGAWSRSSLRAGSSSR